MTLYDNINPRTVKLWTLDVLRWMSEGAPIRGMGKEASLFHVTAGDVANKFGITTQDAYRRITRLRSWGMVKTARRKKPKTYIVTDWGYKFLADKEGKVRLVPIRGRKEPTQSSEEL